MPKQYSAPKIAYSVMCAVFRTANVTAENTPSRASAAKLLNPGMSFSQITAAMASLLDDESAPACAENQKIAAIMAMASTAYTYNSSF